MNARHWGDGFIILYFLYLIINNTRIVPDTLVLSNMVKLTEDSVISILWVRKLRPSLLIQSVIGKPDYCNKPPEASSFRHKMTSFNECLL